MPAIFAKQALTPSGWQSNMRITLQDGKIASATANSRVQEDDVRVDTLLPALANLHSHTFQRAMAGMTEKRGSGTDSFWTWRDLMYRFLQHLTPDDIEAIAAFAFMEMQEAGYGSVAEFHYLHHAAGGVHYDNRAELSARIMSAAHKTGMGLTLLPVLYTYAGLGKKPLTEQQLRFGNSLEDYLLLHSEAASQMRGAMSADCRMGVAPHSLRAVSDTDLAHLASNMNNMPFHMHIAEQTAEVEAVVAATKQRPVEWLLSNAKLDKNWCLVHATHMTSAETLGLARTGAVAGLCPITEANLGDGIFNGSEFFSAQGKYGLGTDSNINISASGELAMLEYSQRLHERQRNVLGQENISTGFHLYTAAAAGSAQALGRHSGSTSPGMWADLVAIDSDDIQLCALKPGQLLDGWIFASKGGRVKEAWSAGRHTVSHGQHKQREAIEATYRRTMARLVDLL